MGSIREKGEAEKGGKCFNAVTISSILAFSFSDSTEDRNSFTLRHSHISLSRMGMTGFDIVILEGMSLCSGMS